MPDNSPGWPVEQLRAAAPLNLSWVPQSDAARALTAAVTSEVVEYERPLRGNARAAKGLIKLQEGVGAVIGGLLVSWGKEPPRPATRSLKRDDFSACRVGYDTYRTIRDAMIALGYVEAKAGIRYERRFSFQGKPEALRPTQRLLELAAIEGVSPATVRDHFHLVPSEAAPATPKELVTMRTVWQREGSKRDRQDVDLSDLDEAGKSIWEQVDKANQSAACGKRVSGAMQPRWKRTFTSTTSTFLGDWTLGGRWTAMGGVDGCYQVMPPALRSNIAIDGEETCEIDVHASILTIAHGLLGLPLPETDLYEIDGLGEVPRRVVKRWVTATLGNGKPLRAWPAETEEDIRRHNARAVGAAVVRRYPWLEGLHEAVLPERYKGLPEPHKLVSHYLAGLEAAAITMAMERVWEHEASELVLPIHDGIICRALVAGDVEEAMKRGYETVCGIRPRTKRSLEDDPWDF